MFSKRLEIMDVFAMPTNGHNKRLFSSRLTEKGIFAIVEGEKSVTVYRRHHIMQIVVFL